MYGPCYVSVRLVNVNWMLQFVVEHAHARIPELGSVQCSCSSVCKIITS